MVLGCSFLQVACGSMVVAQIGCLMEETLLFVVVSTLWSSGDGYCMLWFIHLCMRIEVRNEFVVWDLGCRLNTGDALARKGQWWLTNGLMATT